MNYNIISIHTPALSFCEYEFGFFPKQKVDCAVKNFLFAGNFFFPLTLLTCYQRYNIEKMWDNSV